MKNDVVKKNVHDELVKNVNGIRTIDTSDLVEKASYNTNIEDIA